MAETVEIAKSARDELAAALSVLSLEDAGGESARVAIPLAQATGALYRLESESHDAAQEASSARGHLRAALAALQEGSSPGPSLELALQHVARCLGVIHNLAEELASRPTSQDDFQRQDFQKQGQSHAPRSFPPQATEQAASSNAPPTDWDVPLDGSTRPSQQHASQSLADHLGSTQTSYAHDKAVAVRGAPEPKGQKLERGSRAPARPSERELRAKEERPSNRTHARTMESRLSFGPSSKRAPAPDTIPPAGARHFEAHLAANSPSNFYQGLAGNDVVEHGGVFIATYERPAIGAPLWLKITLPGGYEFEASAVVAWTRESGAPGSPPGFGAKFDKISSQARKLVQRFVRNREPLFYEEP